jgi:hypothetical protein
MLPGMDDVPGHERPPLSVVIPVRGGLEEIAPVIEAVAPGARATGTEVLVVGRVTEKQSPGDPVRLIPMRSADLLDLHRQGIAEATGRVVAIGEDHAVPTPDWCEAVIRAHAEHPEASAIVGCLVNATDGTLAGRANFLAFAAPWQPPMKLLPPWRPPPASTLTFKREALEGVRTEQAGWLEAELIPELFNQGLMVADERIVVEHFQDHGCLWSIQNAFHSARASYGQRQGGRALRGRLEGALWALGTVPHRLRTEAREATEGTPTGAVESTLITVISLAAGLGGAFGSLLGPGRSAERVA